MTSVAPAKESYELDQAALSHVEHLDRSGKIVWKSAKALGYGGFSEVFKGRCMTDGQGEQNVAIKRLRFHLRNADITKVRPSELYLRLFLPLKVDAKLSLDPPT